MGSDITEFLLQVLQLISILASCVGSDIFEFFSIHTADKFQFSLLAWGAMYLLSVE